jgi:drug/metabolite transporter (DMT)-like permease
VIIALVLLSALLHATWNALLRLERDKDRMLILAIIIATMFATVVAAVRWRLGAVPFPTLGGVGFTIVAGVFEAMYFAALARAMERGKLGLVYTISRGGAVVVVWPLSIALFAELAKPSALAGSLVVLGGLTLCGMGAGTKSTGGEQRRSAIAWAVACAGSIAGYHLAYTAALREGVNPSACFALSLGVSAAINVIRFGPGGRAQLGALLRTRWRRLIFMGLVCSGSFLLLMEALATGGGAGYVLTLRNTSVLFAAGMSWWIGEPPSRVELAGATLVAVGAALMAW